MRSADPSSRARCSSRVTGTPRRVRTTSYTLSPKRNPWSNTLTMAFSGGRIAPSIETMVAMGRSACWARPDYIGAPAGLGTVSNQLRVFARLRRPSAALLLLAMSPRTWLVVAPCRRPSSLGLRPSHLVRHGALGRPAARRRLEEVPPEGERRLVDVEGRVVVLVDDPPPR